MKTQDLSGVVTDSLSLTGRLQEQLSVWAAPGRVVIEIVDANEELNAHLTLETARQHILHVQAMIAEAERLERGAQIVPIRRYRSIPIRPMDDIVTTGRWPA